jgi:hypothetical protein
MLTLPEHERLNFKESYNFFSAEKPTTFAEAYLPFFNMMVSWRFHRISKVIQDHYRNAQRYHVPFYVMVEEPYVNILRKQLAAEELSNNVVDYRTIIKAWGTQQEKDLLEAPRFPQQKPATNNMGNTMSSYQRTITMKDLANEKPTHEIKSTSATEVMQAMHKMQSSESDASTQENADLAITQEIPIIDNDLEDADTTQNAQAQPISEAKTNDTYNANEDEEEYDNADAHGDISKTQNIQQPIIQKTTTPSTTTKAPEPTATPAQQTPTKSETVLNVTQNNNSTPTNSAPINTTETMISGGASAVEKKTRFTVKSTSVPAPKTSTTSSTNPTVTATPTTTTTPTSTQPQTTSKAVSAVTKSSNNLSEPTTAITEIQASGSSTAVEQKTTIAAKPLPQPQTKTTATLPNTAQTTVAASATSAKHVQQEAKTSVTEKTAQPLPQTNASVTAQQQPSTQKPDESTTTTTPKVESKQVAVVTSKTTFKPEVKTTTQATTDPTTTIKEQSKSTSVAPETSSELKTKPQASPISASSNTAPDSKKTAPNPDESKTSKATANESIDAVALAQLGETAESFQELINYKDEDAELSTNPSEKPEGWWFDFSDEHNASKEHSSYAEHMKTSPSRPKNPADNEPAKPQSINEVTPKTHAPKNAAWERMSDTPDTTNAESGDDAQPQESSAYESTQSRQKTKSTASPESVITYGADPKAASHSWIESDSSNDSDDEKEEETPPANAPTLQRHYSPRENQDFDVSITYAQDSTSTEDLIPSSPEETEEMKAEKLGEDIATFNRVSENTDDSSDFDNVLLSLGSDDEVTTFARDPNDISYVNCNDEEQATMETMLIDTATQTTSKPARTTLRNRS